MGNYKLNNINKSNAIFPYTQQDDKNKVDKNIAVYALSTIKTPTGGSMHVVYESDDYAYVQDKKATRMFNVSTAQPTDSPNDPRTIDVKNATNSFYIDIDLAEGFVSTTEKS